ncbi:hypothetical protein [Actinacidiphila sp. bgisy160]|uniref:hypothetical protein n=1 Tax=Actinacidiphila sp. bgisy160 TaxID=3413796 RepID=UPI003D70559C
MGDTRGDELLIGDPAGLPTTGGASGPAPARTPGRAATGMAEVVRRADAGVGGLYQPGRLPPGVLTDTAIELICSLCDFGLSAAGDDATA